MKLAVQPTIRTHIGVDAGSAQFKAVQLSGKPGRWQLESTAIVPRLEPGAAISARDIDRLKSVLFRQGFTGDKIVLGTPSSQLVTGVFPVPPANSGAPREQIVRMELGRTHGCNPQQIEVVSWELPSNPRSSSKQTSVMAIGCPHSAAESIIEQFEAGDLQVEAMDVEWMAAVRAAWATFAIPAGNESNPVMAVVDFGEQAARITVLWRSGVVYGRSLSEFGIGKLKSQLQASFDLDDEDTNYVLRNMDMVPSRMKTPASDAIELEQESNAGAESDQDRRLITPQDADVFAGVRVVMRKFFNAFAEELRVSLSYAEEEFAGETNKVALVGGGAGIKGLASHIGQTLSIDTSVASPMQMLSCPPGRERWLDDPSIVTAIGLAMYGHGGGQ